MSENKIFLHSCCGPCTMYPLEVLRQEGFEVQGYFYNPNIHPYREFKARLDSYRQMAAARDLPVQVEEDYGLAAFLEEMQDKDPGVYQAKSAERCQTCYRLRLKKAAQACRQAGLKVFSTTLLVSPYQQHEMIKEAGEQAAAAAGVTFLYRDFRSGFRQGQQKARALNLYMQGYCGCVFSEYERYGGKA